jgi:hypothetical protein
MPRGKITHNNNKGKKLRSCKVVKVTEPTEILDQIKANTGLTSNQIEFLEYMVSLETMPNTIQELVSGSGISRPAFYTWLKELEFIEAYNRVCDLIDCIDRPLIDKANRNEAKKGNMLAQRLYYQRRGLLQTGNNGNQQATQIIINGVDNVG